MNKLLWCELRTAIRSVCWALDGIDDVRVLDRPEGTPVVYWILESEDEQRDQRISEAMDVFNVEHCLVTLARASRVPVDAVSVA